MLPLPDERPEPLTDRLTIFQKRRGYRFGAEAVALARFAGEHPGERGADLGTGSGVVALLMSESARFAHMTGLELQPAYADMARRSVEANRLTERITIVQGDLRRIDEYLPAGEFDFVTGNPPFYPVGTGRASPDEARRTAMTECAATLADFVRAAAFLLAPGGRLYLVHLPARRADVETALGAAGLAPRRLQSVLPRRGAAASFLLFEAMRGGGPCRTEPEIILNS
ncbi:tRNA1(Val) (adenine(37)-N6)-methyltransferase [Feifania hominis]|uniref:Methyltransferase n=1 Tax=Feifania hominis TaxID=2763660 RepID=A0A926HVC8_9FIRM|nr:methyltransferase [Feifania hominis]MBC8537198.1 methyltransferase [Feifania hominis]